MHFFVKNMADPDISDYEFYADDLLLMQIIIPPYLRPLITIDAVNFQIQYVISILMQYWT